MITTLLTIDTLLWAYMTHGAHARKVCDWSSFTILSVMTVAHVVCLACWVLS